MSDNCPKCGTALSPGKNPATLRCENGSTWLANGLARLITHECAAAETATLRSVITAREAELLDVD